MLLAVGEMDTRPPQLDHRPLILVATSPGEALDAARLMHLATHHAAAFAVWDGRFEAARPATLFVPFEAAATPFATLVEAAGGARLIVAVRPGDLDEVDAELRRAAEPPIVLPVRPQCGPLCEGSLEDITQLPYRRFLERARQHLTRRYLAELLRVTHGCVIDAARLAGIERESMHRLLRRHGIHATGYRVTPR